jgi:hypothetical protein
MNKLMRDLWNSVYFATDAGTGAGDTGKPGESGTSAGKDTTLPKGANGSGGGGDGDNKVWNGLEFKDPENLKAVEAKGWQSPEDAVKSYRELESQASKNALKVPDENAKPEEWEAFYKSIGRPEKPDAYEFKLDEKVPENFPYDDNAATSFKDAAHKAGLRPEQAQSLHDWFVGSLAEPWTKSIKDTAAKIEGAHDAIVNEWGDPQGTQYKRNLELADRAIRELGGKDKTALRKELETFGILAPDGKVMAPRIILAMAKVGESLYHEDGVFSGEAVTRNPWKQETENLTEQGRIIKEDPQLAKQLILGANLKPKDFGLQ